MSTFALEDASRQLAKHHPPEMVPFTESFFLKRLLESSILPHDSWLELPVALREELDSILDKNVLLSRLVEENLLTEYQAGRVAKGAVFGLILGNYRVLRRLGVGGMGVVFLCEHLVMRKQVAVKVLANAEEQASSLVQRFCSEIRAVSKIQHPNIVNAFDAGKVVSPDPDPTVSHYFVMEYVPGCNLESLIFQQGPLPVEKACDVVHQIAGALDAAHKLNLVHRDIKPSNIMLTGDGLPKLLDFGLARQFRRRLTDPGAIVGTPEYMAPEQIEDASTVGPRTDIFGLGGVLYWCLTGKKPFPIKDLRQDLLRRATEPAPSARQMQADVPTELDEVIARMMAANLDDRYPSAEAVMRALLPFVSSTFRDRLILGGGRWAGPTLGTLPPASACARVYRVLIVDDDPFTRLFCKNVLAEVGIECTEAATGEEALKTVKEASFDLLLLDVQMPGMSGEEVCRQLRKNPPCRNLKILILSGCWKSDEMAEIMMAGANDFLSKPTTKLQLLARVKAALELKDAQDKSDALNQKLLHTVHELDQSLQSRDVDLGRACKGLVLALARLAEQRGCETRGHGVRLQHYCRRLAEEVAEEPALAGKIDQDFITLLEICAPLHDIGSVCLPDHILLNPGKLSAEEYLIVKTHTVMGDAILRDVAEHYNFSRAFLQMATDLARHHHERFDGTGYPDGLQGAKIPLAARILAIGDAYDAIRSRRPYKPALPHATAVQKIKTATGQFDPVLLTGFLSCEPCFDRIYREISGR